MKIDKIRAVIPGVAIISDIKEYVGKEVLVLVEECKMQNVKRKTEIQNSKIFSCKTRTSKTVKAESKTDEDLVGRVIPVKIIAAREFGLKGDFLL